jgi:hypothetical protein
MNALTISAAARRCGVDRRTLQRAIRTGRLTLTADHRLTPEALAQAGYLPAAVSQILMAELQILQRLDRIEELILKVRDMLEEIERWRHGGFIYAIGIGGTSYVKIGSTTRDVRQRLQALQAGNPLALTLVAALQVQADPVAVERYIHAALGPYHKRGEWYEIDMDTQRLEALVMQAVLALRRPST